VPTITVSLRDLNRLVGRELSVDELSELLFTHKCLVEGVVGDEVHVEVNADRPDMLSAEGLARALRLYMGLEEPRMYAAGDSDVRVRVDPSVEGVRPYIGSAVIRGVELDEEAIRQIMSLQEKLHLTYCRGRAKASIGVHDLDAVSHEITYAALSPDEIRFVPLDEEVEMTGREVLERTEKGREYGHLIRGFDRYPLLFDSKGRVLSMPPIINSSLTKVTERTRNVLLDVTGVDEGVVERVLTIMALNIAERGGVVERVEVAYPGRSLRTPSLTPMEVSVDLEEASRLIGVEVTPSVAEEALRRMGYLVKGLEGSRLTVLAPPYRCDILHPVDVVEDIAIGYGYDRLQPVRPPVTEVGRELDVTRLSCKARELMVGLGFQEVASYMLTSEAVLFDRMRLGRGGAVVLENPVSSEYTCLRTWLTPVLLEFLSHNKHVPYPQRVFECGDVVLLDDARPTMTRSERRLAAALSDRRAGYEDVQAALYSLLRGLGVEGWGVKPLSHPSFIEGRAASLTLDGVELAILGEVHPEVLEAFSLEMPVACFELNLSALLPVVRGRAA